MQYLHNNNFLPQFLSMFPLTVQQLFYVVGSIFIVLFIKDYAEMLKDLNIPKEVTVRIANIILFVVSFLLRKQ